MEMDQKTNSLDSDIYCEKEISTDQEQRLINFIELLIEIDREKIISAEGNFGKIIID